MSNDDEFNEFNELEENLFDAITAEEALKEFNESGMHVEEAFSELEIKDMKALFNSKRIRLHRWVKGENVIVIPITPIYETHKKKYEMFDAKIVSEINGVIKLKQAKINVFQSMRTQFQKIVAPLLKDGTVNRKDITYKTKIVSKQFAMQFTGSKPSNNFPGKFSKSIIIELIK